MAGNNVTPIPYELVPAQPDGFVTDAQYIKDGQESQHEINERTIKGDVPQDDGMYIRKNGVWSKLIIDYNEETQTLIIDTRGEINNN